MYKTPHFRSTFRSCDVEKVHAVVARSTFRSHNVQNTTCTRHFWRFRCRFAWQAQGIVHLSQKRAKRDGLVEFPKTMAGMGHLKRICKDAFSVAGAVQETSSSELLGGEVRALISWERLHFGESAWQVQHFVWPGITFSWQAQYFRQVDWKNRKTHWYKAVSSALNFPFLKEISQNCFVFDVVKFKNWISLTELIPFGCCPVQKMKSLAELLRFWCCQV